MVTKYTNPKAGDVLVHEESAIVCRESVFITNPTAADFLAIPGQPVAADGTLILAGGEANVGGLLLADVQLGPSEVTKIQHGIVARGPAAINVDKIALVDSAGGTLNQASVVAALEALGMVMRWEPTESDTQIN